MDLPDMSCVVADWATEYEVTNITRVTKDFVPQDIHAKRPVMLMVQPAQTKDLKNVLIDSALDYQMIHALSLIENNERFTYCDTEYRFIKAGKWLPYGYQLAIAEEVKRDATQH